MDVNNIVNQIKVIENNRRYYFVRTDSGTHFDEFVREGYIGLGWNHITLFDLRNLTDGQIKLKIANNIDDEEFDRNSSNGKRKLTSILNKIKSFRDMEKGSVVIIPTHGSNKLAFGVIDDDTIYRGVPANELDACPYYKRRKVDWKEVKWMSELNPIFFKITNPWHSISNITSYHEHIDFVMNSVYIKNGMGHFVFDVHQQNEINAVEILNLVNSFQEHGCSVC